MSKNSNMKNSSEPKGTILVISPWNGAWVLSITPLVIIFYEKCYKY